MGDCHYLLTLKFLQTCTSFFPLLNTKKYIFLRMLVTKQLTVAIDFHSIFFYTMEVNGYHQLEGE